MVHLEMEAKDFGFQSFSVVRAAYNTLEEALAQARHNLRLNTQRPLRIVSEDGLILWRVEDE